MAEASYLESLDLHKVVNDWLNQFELALSNNKDDDGRGGFKWVILVTCQNLSKNKFNIHILCLGQCQYKYEFRILNAHKYAFKILNAF